MAKKIISTIIIFVFTIQSTGAYALSRDTYAQNYLRSRSANQTPVPEGMRGAMHEATGQALENRTLEEKAASSGRFKRYTQIGMVLIMAIFSEIIIFKPMIQSILKPANRIEFSGNQKAENVVPKNVRTIPSIEDVRTKIVPATPKTKPAPSVEALTAARDLSEAAIEYVNADKDSEFKRNILFLSMMIQVSETKLRTRKQYGYGPGRGFSQFEAARTLMEQKRRGGKFTAQDLWRYIILKSDRQDVYQPMMVKIIGNDLPGIAALDGYNLGQIISNPEAYSYADLLNAALTIGNIERKAKERKLSIPDRKNPEAVYKFYIRAWAPGKPISLERFQELTKLIPNDLIDEAFTGERQNPAYAGAKQEPQKIDNTSGHKVQISGAMHGELKETGSLEDFRKLVKEKIIPFIPQDIKVILKNRKPIALKGDAVREFFRNQKSFDEYIDEELFEDYNTAKQDGSRTMVRYGEYEISVARYDEGDFVQQYLILVYLLVNGTSEEKIEAKKELSKYFTRFAEHKPYRFNTKNGAFELSNGNEPESLFEIAPENTQIVYSSFMGSKPSRMRVARGRQFVIIKYKGYKGQEYMLYRSESHNRWKRIEMVEAGGKESIEGKNIKDVKIRWFAKPPSESVNNLSQEMSDWLDRQLGPRQPRDIDDDNNLGLKKELLRMGLLADYSGRIMKEENGMLVPSGYEVDKTRYSCSAWPLDTRGQEKIAKPARADSKVVPAISAVGPEEFAEMVETGKWKQVVKTLKELVALPKTKETFREYLYRLDDLHINRLMSRMHAEPTLAYFIVEAQKYKKLQARDRKDEAERFVRELTVAFSPERSAKLQEMKTKIQNGEKVRILFVCSINNQRSFLMEMISKDIIEKSGLNNVSVSSCGYDFGASAYEPLAEICIEKGIDRNIVKNFKGRKIDSGILESADYVIAADSNAGNGIRKDFPAHSAKIMLVGDVLPGLVNKLQAYSSARMSAHEMPDFALLENDNRVSTGEYFDIVYGALKTHLFGLKEDTQMTGAMHEAVTEALIAIEASADRVMLSKDADFQKILAQLGIRQHNGRDLVFSGALFEKIGFILPLIAQRIKGRVAVILSKDPESQKAQRAAIEKLNESIPDAQKIILIHPESGMLPEGIRLGNIKYLRLEKDEATWIHDASSEKVYVTEQMLKAIGAINVTISDEIEKFKQSIEALKQA